MPDLRPWRSLTSLKISFIELTPEYQQTINENPSIKSLECSISHPLVLDNVTHLRIRETDNLDVRGCLRLKRVIVKSSLKNLFIGTVNEIRCEYGQTRGDAMWSLVTWTTTDTTNHSVVHIENTQ